MREILFKAKRTDNGEWVEGYYFTFKGKTYITNIEQTFMSAYYTEESVVDFNLRAYEVDPATLCQYTGLTDKNGKRIWKGDIVSFVDMTSTESGYYEQDCIGRIGWDDEELCFFVTGRLFAESWEVLQDCAVVGNIFDNQELLEEAHE